MYLKSKDQWLKRLSQFFSILGILTILFFNIRLAPVAHAAVLVITVDTQVDSNDPTYQACTAAVGDCSLRGAISKANADSNTAYTIELPKGTYTLTVGGIEDDNVGGDLDFKSSLTIVGSGEESTVIVGNNLDRVLHVQRGVTVEISNVEITGGRPSTGSDGGGIFNSGTLTLSSCNISGNTAGWGGAGGYGNSGGDGGDGGGIYNDGVLTIAESTIVDNEAGFGGTGGGSSFYGGMGGNGGYGGGIYNSGTLTFTVSTVNHNNAGGGGQGGWGDWGNGPSGISGSGGGLFNTGRLTFIQGTIRNNWSGSGGGIFNDGTLTLLYNTISYNTTANSGGGIFNYGTLTLLYNTISNNTTGNGGSGYSGKMGCFPGGAGGYGGGIYNTGIIVLANSIISNNTTGDGGEGGAGWEDYGCNGGPGGYGGGIYNSGVLNGTKLTVSNNTTGNGGPGGLGLVGFGSIGTDGFGGGIYVAAGSAIILTNTNILSNATGSGSSGSIGGSGGGLFMDSISKTTWINTIIGGNTTGSGSSGSGLFITNSSFSLVHSTVAQNTGGDGSGIYVTGSTLSLTNTILVSQTVGITVTANSAVTLEATLWGSGIWANQNDLGGNGTIITGTHNYWGNPAFVNPAVLNYHIQSTSEAIDRGINAGVTIDIDNWPRPNPDTSIPDLGADEYYNSIPVYLPLILYRP